jgi:deaminated glutathione amidase
MRVAAVQLNSNDETAANLASADRHVRAAAAAGAKLIVLPEKWTAMGAKETLLAAAQTLDGPAVSWARKIAAELAVDLVAGSFTERVPGSAKLANACLHVDPAGEIRAIYRKIHMFDVEIDGRSYRESELEDPGSEIVLSESANGLPLGLAICYDLRFPELFRILALRGALTIAMPSAFTLPTTREHWEILIRARAIENQAFMIAANQAGKHPDGYESGGRSMIVDPWGRVLASLGEREEGHVVAEIDLDAQAQVRQKLPSLANRAPQAYRWPEASIAAGTPRAA